MGKTFSTGLLTNGVFQDSSNNIGIGAAANASFKLQVTGTTNLTGALSGTSATFSSSVTANGAIKVQTTANGTNAINFGTSSTNYHTITYDDSTGKLTFNTDSSRIVSFLNSNVGIGTSSPDNKLGILGANNSTPQSDGISIYANNGTVFTKYGWGGLSAQFDYFFYTAGSERMRITSGGYLKVSNNGVYNGLSAAYHEFNLNVSDSPTLVVKHNGSSPYGIFTAFSTDPNNTTNYIFQGYSYSSSTNLYTIWSNGTVSGRSDIRLKKNIIDSTPKLHKLMQLRVVNYEWKESINGTKELGLIAQEVEEVFPNLVITEPIKKKREIEQEDGTIVEEEYIDGDSKSVKNSVLPYITIKALQELTTLVKEQQAQIEELKAKIK
jgi:hypothetical protein